MTEMESLVELWLGRAKARHPSQAAQFTDDEIRRSLGSLLGAMAPLEITEHADQVRYLFLSVLITPEQRRSNLIKGALMRVLSNFDWTPAQRLDFIYTHLVSRPASPDEEDFGPDFVPPASGAAVPAGRPPIEGPSAADR